jgi:copper oxidase (laccase) domain-containing protein
MSNDKLDIVEAREDIPVDIDIEASASRVRAMQQQQTVEASTQVHGDDVIDATVR